MIEPEKGQTIKTITVTNADEVRDLCGCCRRSIMPAVMGGYSDYCMLPPRSKQPAGGICHPRGVNADLPPQWLIYITVTNLRPA